MALGLQASGAGSDTLAPTIQSFSLNASSFDPSQLGGAYLSAAIRFSDNLSGFDWGELIFRSTSSGQTLSFDFYGNPQGTSLAGTHYASEKLNTFTAAGTWVLDSINLEDKAGNSLYKNSIDSDWTTFLSSSGITQTSFQIAYGPNPTPGSGPDTHAPSIQGLSLSSLSLDPSQPGGAYLSAAIRFSDNLSGFDWGELIFRSTSSGQTLSFDFYGNPQGTSLAGTHYASEKLNTFTAAGTWVLDSINLEDKAGNSLYKNSIDSDWTTFLSSSGITQTSFQIAYGPNPTPGSGPDTHAPSIQGLSLSSLSLDPSQPGGAYLSAAIRFSDNLSGFDWGELIFRSTSSGQTLSFDFYGNPQGTSLAGTHYASEKLNTFTAAGTWVLDSINLEDKAGNSLYKNSIDSDWTTFLSSSGITQTSFQVDYRSNSAPAPGLDSLAPTIQGFSLDSSTLDPSQPGGAFLSGRLSFSDNISGFSSGYLSFTSDSGKSISLYFGSSYWTFSNVVSGSELSGVAFGSEELDTNTEAGTWRLTGVKLSDHANNSFYKSYSSSDWATFLSSSGITQTSFQVAYGTNPAPAPGADSLAPTIQGFSLDSSSLDPSQPGGAFLSGRLSFRDNISGFNNGSLGFRSDSGESTSLNFAYFDNISGSDLSGVAFASSQLNANAAAGTWRLTSIYLSDNAYNSLSKDSSSPDWTTFLSSSGITQTSFEIAYGPNPAPGTGPDSLPPSIQSFSLDSSSLDPSQPGGAFLSGRLSFRDNVSGFSYGSLRFSSDTAQSTSLSFDASDIISGTELSGVAFASSQLNVNAAAGTWRLTSISLQDRANNSISKSSYDSDWTTFLSSSGITQASFDVVYGADSIVPAISLTVSPASVAEDGTANLVYTFTRTGPTTSALTVNYTVGGTATLGTDYTGIAASPATKTVSFAAGASSAIVMVDPTTDTTIEPNETVVLTLAEGSDYSIRTTAAVVGTIINSNPPPYTGTDSLPPTFQGFTLNSTSFDPSQPGGAYISAAIRFSDNLSGFNYGFLGFRSLSSGQLLNLNVNSYPQASSRAGTIYASAKLNPFIAAGSWALDSIQLTDKAGNSFVKYSSASDWNTFLITSGITQTSFQVVYGPNAIPGSGSDSLAPIIQGFSLDSSSFDPSQLGGAYLRAALQFSDNLSGWSRTNLTYRSTTSGDYRSLDFNINRLQGSTLAGTAYASTQLNSSTAAGSWVLNSISLADNAGNTLLKSTYDSDWSTFLTSSGITQTSFQVAYGPNPTPSPGADSLAPIIQGFALISPSLDPSQPGGALLAGRLSFTDNISGYSYGYFTFSSDSGQSITLNFGYPGGAFLASGIISGSELSGVAFGSTQLSANAAPGTWRLSRIFLVDKANNSLSKSSSSSDWNTYLSSSGINQTSFQVAYGPNPVPGSGADTIAPTLQGLSLDSSTDSSTLDPTQPGGAFLSGRLSFRDNVSGFNYCYLTFSSDSGQSTRIYFVSKSIISGTDLSGVAFGSAPLIANPDSGIWRLTSVQLSDKANNYIFKSSSSSDWATFLSSSGITQPSFDVVYGEAPTTPVISLAVSPVSVSEDGTDNLVYTFSRTGSTSSALTVNYTVGGTASLGTDYSGIVASPATKTVTFAAGAATATVTVDPTADVTIEPDETVALTLAAGSSYSIANTVAVDGTILNDDTALDSQGNTALLRGGDGQPFAKAGSSATPITFMGSPASAGSASSTWQMLAAETIGTANKILWRYNPTGQLHVWALDSNWAWTGADTGLVDPNSSAGWELESSFQLDLNGDAIIGTPFTAIESQGNTSLVRHTSTGQPYASAGPSTTPITFMGSPASPGNASSTWQMLAAETIGRANKILWRYNPTGQVHVWALDANWAWTGADTGLVDTISSAGWELETSFQLDLNSDAIIGAPFTAIESQGNTSLVRHTSTGQPYASAGPSTTPISFMGSPASPGNASSTWQMLAAETIGTANKILWRYNPTGQLHVWALDSNWAWTGADTGLVDPNSSAGWELESSFQLDLNGDAIIGTPFTAIESQGNTSLVRHTSTGQPYASAGPSTTPITFMGSPASPGNASSTWQMLAAETIGTANKILWRYNPTGQLHMWALDSNWAWTGADTGLVDPNSSAGWELEASFQLDLNADSIIGTPFTAIESQGNTSLVRHTSTGQPYASAGPSTTPITFMGSPASPGNASSTWQMLAAETIGTANKILWRYNPTGQVHVWALDSNWAWTGADTGLVDPNSSAGANLLVQFGVGSI